MDQVASSGHTVWPWHKCTECASDTAASRSAPGSTTRALLPPSSKCARFRLRLAVSPTFRPAAVEPVNDTNELQGLRSWLHRYHHRPVVGAVRPASFFQNAHDHQTTGNRGADPASTAQSCLGQRWNNRTNREDQRKLNGEITVTTPADDGERTTSVVHLKSAHHPAVRCTALLFIAFLCCHVEFEVGFGWDSPGLFHNPRLQLFGVLLKQQTRFAQNGSALGRGYLGPCFLGGRRALGSCLDVVRACRTDCA